MKRLTIALCAVAMCTMLMAQETGERPSVPIKKIIRPQAQDEDLREAPQLENTLEGVEAPDFTLKDIKGSDLTLSSLRGKYVVLDFWGSWCVWCVRGIPTMKEYYAKYEGQYEVVGVDCGDTEEKWMAAVAEYELPWLHVYCPRENTLPQSYGIKGFPTKIVVDPEGKIAKVFIGESEEFYNYLDSLFPE